MKKINGRDGEIRTLDLLIPNQARYQAAPRPDQRAVHDTEREGHLANGFSQLRVQRFFALSACGH